MESYSKQKEGFPGGSNGKESASNAEDLGSVSRLRRSLGEGNGYPLQYSCLESPMDRGAWQATLHGVTKTQTRLSTHPDLHSCSQQYHCKMEVFM